LLLHRRHPPRACMCATQDEAKAVGLLIDCLALILCHVPVTLVTRAKLRHSIRVSSITRVPAQRSTTVTASFYAHNPFPLAPLCT
jgi:hypothetical protein